MTLALLPAFFLGLRLSKELWRKEKRARLARESFPSPGVVHVSAAPMHGSVSCAPWRRYDIVYRIKPHMSRYSEQRRAGTPLESLRPETLLPWSSAAAEVRVSDAWRIFTRRLAEISHAHARDHYAHPAAGARLRQGVVFTTPAGNDEASDDFVRRQAAEAGVVPPGTDILVMSEGLAAGTAAFVWDSVVEPPEGTVIVVADVGSE